MSTESVDPRYVDLDRWPLASALEAMLEGQMAAIAALRPAMAAITAATEAAAERLRGTGRLIYVGAGSSGRIAVQDGTELAPTYSWPRERLVVLMAGGNSALLQSVEGAEDDVADGMARIDALDAGAADVVIGIAASGTTPFTVAAVRRARERGALTIGIACNGRGPLLEAALMPVIIETGSEIVAGSTRMKAGTAQKAALNLMSTGIMLRLGGVYGGMMVDMQAGNAKLKRRAAQIVARAAEVSVEQAADALAAAQSRIKPAILIARGASRGQADALLDAARGDLRAALERLPPLR